ncbi:MAG: LysM peptidoglycan-binding domain-containing protein [Treponema sp.]|jgi:hypothetical protein|nr:LysM peptidoglycan-binding domain-containing protein [Treponema sp.]
MSDKAKAPFSRSQFRFIDGLVLVVFISTAFLGFYLFQRDLRRTIESLDMDPAGIIIIRNNIVQRRHGDRVLWDRIYVDSPVYPGDLIRAADLSDATVDIKRNEIHLTQNTLIRIEELMESLGIFNIELREGNLIVTSTKESSGIMLNLMGTKVQTTSGSVINAAASEDGISVQVNEGKAELTTGGQTREITEGALLMLDKQGTERIVPAVVVTQPAPNARYLKNSPQNLAVNFLWRRINLDAEENLRLEIASDVNFKNNYRVINTTDNSAQVSFGAGHWYWKLSREGTALSAGHFSIADSSGPALTSPVPGSRFLFYNNPPAVRFQWTEKQNTSGYTIEVSKTVNFTDLRLTRRTTSTSLISSELEQGTWYWRVKPVFPSNYEGETSYSYISSFTIEKTADISAPAIELPVTPVEVIRPSVTAQSAVETPTPAEPRRPPAIVQTPIPSEPRRPPTVQSSTTPTPVETPRPTVTAEQTATIPRPSSTTTTDTRRYYTVKPGDTLGRIARQYYGDPMQWNRISGANNIANPDLIFPDQVFLIP